MNVEEKSMYLYRYAILKACFTHSKSGKRTVCEKRVIVRDVVEKPEQEFPKTQTGNSNLEVLVQVVQRITSCHSPY